MVKLFLSFFVETERMGLSILDWGIRVCRERDRCQDAHADRDSFVVEEVSVDD